MLLFLLMAMHIAFPFVYPPVVGTKERRRASWGGHNAAGLDEKENRCRRNAEMVNSACGKTP